MLVLFFDHWTCPQLKDNTAPDEQNISFDERNIGADEPSYWHSRSIVAGTKWKRESWSENYVKHKQEDLDNMFVVWWFFVSKWMMLTMVGDERRYENL